MSANKSILAFAGRNGCGKGTAAERAATLLTAPKHTYSDELYDRLAAWGVKKEDVTRPMLQDLSTFLRKHFGEDFMARGMAAKCAAAPGAHVVIDGVRRLTDIEILQAEYGERFVLVWIEASADERYARLKARKEKNGEEMMSREAFDAQEQAESERQFDDVRRACRTVIDNDGSAEALISQIDAVVAAVNDFGPVAHG
jgi:dephospho-CoA kinase